MSHRVSLTIRVARDVGSQLEQRRRRTGVPTNVFVGRLIADALAREADGRDRPSRRRLATA